MATFVLGILFVHVYVRTLYFQVAMTSGSGVVIQPVRNTPQILALTMGTFVTRLLGQLNGQTNLPPGPPQVKHEGSTGLLLHGCTHSLVAPKTPRDGGLAK